MHSNPSLRFCRRAVAQVTCLIILTAFHTPAVGAQLGLKGVVNLNEAPVKQLALLPGIGAKKAARIVTYRAKRKFKRTVELARVRGIGLRTVRKLKVYLCVQGPSTLQRANEASAPPGE